MFNKKTKKTKKTIPLISETFAPLEHGDCIDNLIVSVARRQKQWNMEISSQMGPGLHLVFKIWDNRKLSKTGVCFPSVCRDRRDSLVFTVKPEQK